MPNAVVTVDRAPDAGSMTIWNVSSVSTRIISPASCDEACARRNISLTGYLRRAAAAMIAHDLKLPFEEVAQHAARPMPYGKHGGTFKKIKSQDDGKDFGYWIIAKLLRHEPTTEE